MIIVDKVYKNYGSGEGLVKALRGVTLTVKKSDFLCVWGASGSGKSTLLNIIGMLDRPDSGTVSIDGQDVLSMKDSALSEFRSKHVGFIFQNFNLVPVLSAFENVMIPLQISGVKNDIAKKKTIDILNEMGLSDKLNKRPDEMSGGQRQRVAIARALVNDPSIVLADEPTANLDSVTGKSIIELMKNLNVTRKVTFVFSSHDPMLLDYATTNIYLKDGAIDNQVEESKVRIAGVV